MKNTRNGETLINNTEHQAKTDSVGFCFFDLEDFTPEEAMHFVSGIVSLDICAVFETDKKLTKSFGRYAKPIEQTGNNMEDILKLLLGFHDSFEATEYCTSEYSNKDFKLVKYTEKVFRQWKPREEQSELKWKINR